MAAHKPNVNWAACRAEYETGTVSTAQLSAKYGVSDRMIRRKATIEQWERDTTGLVGKMANLAAAGVAIPEEANLEAVSTALDRESAKLAAGVEIQKATRTDALFKAAQLRAEVLIRHRQEWEEHKRLMDIALDTGDIADARTAKVLAETIRIRQEGERLAWGIKDNTSDSGTQVQQTIKFAWDKQETEV